MQNIIFIAPPAAGKGTQSEKLVTKYNYTHISTGDLLREEIKKDSDLGKEIKSLIDQGKLVPDEIVTKMLENKLASTKGNFILDGYPRVYKQAEILATIFEELNICNDDVVAIYLDLDENIATKRALGRLTCGKCGKGYHSNIQELMPKNEGYCDDCNETLTKRDDDNEETFKVRFNTYVNETSPLLNYYREKGILKIVDSNKSSNEVFEEIEQILTGDRLNG